MIEMELIGREVALIRCCLRYRVAELDGDIREIYLRLIREMKGVGLYQFIATESACLVLGLLQFASHAVQIGHVGLGDQARQLAEWVHSLAFGSKLADAIKLLEQSPGTAEMAVLARAI